MEIFTQEYMPQAETFSSPILVQSNIAQVLGIRQQTSLLLGGLFRLLFRRVGIRLSFALHSILGNRIGGLKMVPQRGVYEGTNSRRN